MAFIEQAESEKATFVGYQILWLEAFADQKP